MIKMLSFLVITFAMMVGCATPPPPNGGQGTEVRDRLPSKGDGEKQKQVGDELKIEEFQNAEISKQKFEKQVQDLFDKKRLDFSTDETLNRIRTSKNYFLSLKKEDIYPICKFAENRDTCANNVSNNIEMINNLGVEEFLIRYFATEYKMLSKSYYLSPSFFAIRVATIFGSTFSSSSAKNPFALIVAKVPTVHSNEATAAGVYATKLVMLYYSDYEQSLLKQQDTVKQVIEPKQEIAVKKAESWTKPVEAKKDVVKQVTPKRETVTKSAEPQTKPVETKKTTTDDDFYALDQLLK